MLIDISLTNIETSQENNLKRESGAGNCAFFYFYLGKRRRARMCKSTTVTTSPQYTTDLHLQYGR